ncbi:MAG TPA: glucose-6-phosphate isomerase, partial [Casimicrobiaceae bacterium]|nr:glucose-6-phosphate isomerase [Casimicrobiaceae bacterium]
MSVADRSGDAGCTLTTLAEWRALQTHATTVGTTHLRDLFAVDAARGTTLVAEAAGLYVDYSKQRITAETIDLLLALAQRRRVRERAAAMFRGEAVNT